MSVTLFTDLPDLVILDILRYLSSFDAIQSFYNIINESDRILHLLIEARCFSSIHHLRLPLFRFVCDHVFPRINSELSYLTLYDHQLNLAREKHILSYLSNLSSLHLKNILEIKENNNDLAYFLHKHLQNLTIEFVNEHHIDAQAFVCEQFIFNCKSENLISCHLTNIYGIQLQHLLLFPNSSIQIMTIQLKQLSDLHILFDHLPNIKILNIELRQWTIEGINYDYTKLPKKLPHLIEFSLQVQHVLSFNRMLKIIEYLIHLEKLSFIYRNYDEHGININQLELILNNLKYLAHFHFLIKFIFFNLNPKLTFENNISLKHHWNVFTYTNSFDKNYLAYTQPFTHRSYSMSTDILMENNSIYFPSITNLSLTTHTKQIPLIQLLNIHFPSLTHLHIVDSSGFLENDNSKLPKIHSLDASEFKQSKLFEILFQSLPNLTHLHVKSNILLACNTKLLLANNHIKHLQLLTNNLDEISEILTHFSALELLIINCKKQSNEYQRKFYRIILDWFQICSRLYTIHIQAHKLSDLFYSTQMESDETIHVHVCNEMFTVWR